VTGLPELHGWLPARVVAAREGVAASTVRSWAARDLIDAIPNPVGPGRLYRVRTPIPTQSMHEHPERLPAVSRSVSVPIRVVRGPDLIALDHLPRSAAQVAAALGVCHGTASRRLNRLERAGLAERSEQVPPGPRGGRPAIIWRPTDG